MTKSTSTYDEAARLLAHSVKQDEIYLDPQPKFNDDFVKMNVIHTRQDVILLVSYLSSLGKQIAVVRYLLGAIFIGIMILVFK